MSHIFKQSDTGGLPGPTSRWASCLKSVTFNWISLMTVKLVFYVSLLYLRHPQGWQSRDQHIFPGMWADWRRVTRYGQHTITLAFEYMTNIIHLKIWNRTRVQQARYLSHSFQNCKPFRKRLNCYWEITQRIWPKLNTCMRFSVDRK